ncbi:tRNA-dihydrouridine synthase 3 [Rhizoctonia solani AG-1 IB]|uniref:tRNA-dihydrouridine(47) synthase [NAD(P)(+)] n=1 Tax=Thanatephorus cucumeris (strain AG1-IB / isolate 7/3/14) TaxID=1108050 RepID=A0A0B7FLG6_THACB|nr:tRNA-dihydrouridine synthase 3 [Rhizoctonia solani AG-1 IB]
MAMAIESSGGARQWPSGMAPIKLEYLIGDPFTSQRDIPDDDAAEGKTSNLPKKRPAEESAGAGDHVDSPLAQSGQKPDESEVPNGEDGEPVAKKQRIPASERRRLAKEARKEQKGANKARKFARIQDEVALCHGASRGEGCIDGEGCRFSHDIPHYLSTKATDLAFPPKESLLVDEPFVSPPEHEPLSSSHPNINKAAGCPNFACSGKCQSGFKCRYLGSHVELQESEAGDVFKLVEDEERYNKLKNDNLEFNFPSSGLQKALRTHKYPFPIADAYMTELSRLTNEDKSGQPIEPPLEAPHKTDEVDPEAQKDTPDVPLRASEKKRLRWQGMSYLAPLTTVGNLPFRRLCAGFGAQITCSEMALSQSLLQGANSEWSLVRRHPSERVYGVQIAGSKVPQLARTAELLANEFGPKNGRERAQIDFVDVNCGCPIDLVFKTGAGSALLDNHNKLGRILIGMSRALGEVPLTIKVRTGIKDGRNNSHKLMPRLARWGVNAFTIHGRTRQQRYSKFADWGYIKECVEALRASTEDDDLPTIPIFGGGDVYSAEQYWTNVEQTGVDGIMVGRGALIKPWIFTEIAERREWDISSRERLDMIRQYAEYGLNHWGSDTVGVNNTRRFLCEALSFTYRYVPIGLLERLPGKINERPPAYRGRDELECLLASNKSSDWVRISEMFLGPAPEGWSFIPKHKSNAQGSEEGNG